MSTFRNTDHVTGWSTVGFLARIAFEKMLTAVLTSFPIMWLVRHTVADTTLRFVFGADGFSYWHCVGLFVIWFTARVRIKFSGPALIAIEGDR